ncbi:MAG TPA: GFA family protein [Stellaceae bacterium]|jgi:hypothetical protein|nr:GFA family protein [Stellaceae bacterium]
MPATIWQRLLDNHLHPPKCDDNRWETAVLDDIGTSGLRVLRRYCPRCGSPLTTEPDLTPDLMMVKAGTLDSNEWFRPVWELFVSRRRLWVSPVLGSKQIEANPEL